MYIKRDIHGKIVAVSIEPAEHFIKENISAHSAELSVFFNSAQAASPAETLRETDADVIRVLEDLIDLLAEKGFIQFTELPAAAQHKLLSRQSIRKRLNGLQLLPDESEDDTISL